MTQNYYEVESFKLFSESAIWQLNRDFYQEIGIEAWSSGLVPHQMTSSSMVGKTYAELILGFLKDVATKGNTTETVYILELGAGHGRLAFHILQHLQKMVSLLKTKLPPYCYVLSDIVEKNLLFFKKHPQLQTYFQQGILDYAYFDAIGSKTIELQYSKKTIYPKDLTQPIVAIANYFFDSIPNDLFLVQNQEVAVCSVSLKSMDNPAVESPQKMLTNLRLTYKKTPLEKPFYLDVILNDILEEYRKTINNSHIFFPQKGLQCLNNLIDFSDKGLMLISMDKGFHRLSHIDHKKEPDVVTHGSFSLWVNYHAFGRFCHKKGGKTLFPAYSTFHLQIGCLLFLDENDSYTHTNVAYQQSVNDFGPDDFNSLKKMAYRNISNLLFVDLIAFLRLSAYDANVFLRILPQLKKAAQSITFNDRNRLEQTLHKVWSFYFNIHETDDLAYELGCFFYDLGFYQAALDYFQYSVDIYGQKGDIYYNKILCFYQLRQDNLFSKTLKEAKETFPNNTDFKQLDKLNLNAV